MLDAFIGVIESTILAGSYIYHEYRRLLFGAFVLLALLHAGIGTYRYLNRHEVLDAVISRVNSSTNGPYGSYVTFVNVSDRKGPLQITVIDGTGKVLGRLTTREILPYEALQFSAMELEGSIPSSKLPMGGANIPAQQRVGIYMLHVEANFEAHAQHLYFDGEDVMFTGTISYRKKTEW